METKLFTIDEVKAIVRDVIRKEYYNFTKSGITDVVDEYLKETKTIESSYPALEKIENIFNKQLQKESNTAFKYRNVSIRRNLMIKILDKYYDVEFTYNDMRIKLNDNRTDKSIFTHFEYLKNNNFIESVSGDKFRFIERVRRWKEIGRI
jgi:hypothetical protein